MAATITLNPAPAPSGESVPLHAVDVLVVNESEVAVLAGSDGDPQHAARRLLGRGPGAVVVTLGAAGVVGVTRDAVTRVAAHDVEVVDTTGAGDCFVGYLAATLGASGRRRHLDEALRRANAAAALSVGRAGAGSSMPTAAEVDALVGQVSRSER